MLGFLTSILPERFRSLTERFKQGPMGTVDELCHFVQTRSAYVAQTSLYGYLKTRMGTRFVEMFKDEVFAGSIRLSRTKIFLSCLSDLTVFAVALVAKDERLDAQSTANLANHIYRQAANNALEESGGSPDLPDAVKRHEARCILMTDWDALLEAGVAFTGSGEDLVRHAPVVDEFKELDKEIVSNSIKFRWRDIRDQLRKRVDGPAISADWRALN